MNISVHAKALGISKYSPEFEEFCKTDVPVSILDKDNILKLEEKYGFLGEHIDPLFECADSIAPDSSLSIYGGYVAAYLAKKDIEEARRVSVPIPDENSAMRYFPLLVLCAALPYGIEKYRARGFSEDEIYETIHPTFKSRLAISYDDTKKMGLDAPGFSWLRLYAIAGVFPAGVFNVTPKYFRSGALLIKNRLSGEIVPLLSGTFHRTGMPIACDGFNDLEGSFEADVSESEDAFFGYPAKNSRATRERCEYRKSEWERLLSKGDGYAGLHIPRGADLSLESMKESFDLAINLTRERYPEYNAKAVFCTSWMLDPRLKELLGENSKISGFINQFIKFPAPSSNRDIFGFVFPRYCTEYDKLPEDTSLQRKIKELYLSGEYIFSFNGILKK